MGPPEFDRCVARCFSCDVSDAPHHRATPSRDWRQIRTDPAWPDRSWRWRHRLHVAPALAALLEFHSAIEPDPAPPTFAGVVPCTRLKRLSGPRGAHTVWPAGGTF